IRLMEKVPTGSQPEHVEELPEGERMRQVWLRSLRATALALLVALGLRFTIGLPTPAELFSDRITVLIPLPLFSRLLELFGHNAKHWFYGALLLGEGLLTLVAGVAYVWQRRAVARRWPGLARQVRLLGPLYRAVDMCGLVLFLWLLSAGIFAPLVGGGLFGARLVRGASASSGLCLPLTRSSTSSVGCPSR